MKIFLLLYYAIRSVLLRGLINTLMLLSGESIFEKQFGIRSAGIKRSSSSQFFHYQGAAYRPLLKVLSACFEQTKHCEFVDIGCGKGRAVFAAENKGYNILKGIELDAGLVAIAKDNQKRYRLKRSVSDINFQHANALDFAYKNKPTVYFLFNPFNEKILASVLDKIMSVSRSETWFIYMNPLFREAFEKRNISPVKKIKTRFYTEALIYKINPVLIQS